MSEVIPLHLLDAGQSGRIVDIDGHEASVVRLHEMGIGVGETFEIRDQGRMMRAGTPCILAVDNQRLSFRHGRSAVIFVETA